MERKVFTSPALCLATTAPHQKWKVLLATVLYNFISPEMMEHNTTSPVMSKNLPTNFVASLAQLISRHVELEEPGLCPWCAGLAPGSAFCAMGRGQPLEDWVRPLRCRTVHSNMFVCMPASEPLRPNSESALVGSHPTPVQSTVTGYLMSLKT